MADISTTLDNVLAHWEMDESSGTRSDSSGNSISLTANGTGGIGSASGALSNAADLEASDTDYFSYALYSAPNSNFSFSFWYKPESLPTSGGYQQIIFKWGGVGSRCWNPYIQENAGQYRITWDFRSPSNQVSSGYAQVSMSTGTWYHIVMAHNISTPSSTVVYLNGSAQSMTTSSSTATSVATGSSDLLIGSDASSGLDGLLDSFTITSDIITSGEVTTLYNSGTPLAWSGGGGGGGSDTRGAFLAFM